VILNDSFDTVRIFGKSKWLEQNLAYNFNVIYNDPAEAGGYIQGINLLGDDRTDSREFFSIALCSRYMGQFTAFCPEIIGCVSQGDTKHEALSSLCVALSECTILNYEHLNINPFTQDPSIPSFRLVDDQTIFSPVDMARLLFLEFNITTTYLTTNNIIMKHDKHPYLSFVIPLKNINVGTQMMLCMLAQRYIGGSKMLEGIVS
jgi:predicted RNase H-like HicB family nuclease